jgi:hypothetical protein
MKNYNASFLPSGGMTRHTLAFVQAFLLICPPDARIGQNSPPFFKPLIGAGFFD